MQRGNRAQELDVMLGARTFRGLLRFILCWLGSVATGYAVFGGAIFHYDNSAFQFVAIGVIAGVVAVFATCFRSKGMLGVFIGSILAVIAITGSTTPAQLLRFTVMVISVFLSVGLGVRWDKVFPRVALGKFVLWAAGFGLIRCVAVVLLGATLRIGIDFQVIVQAAMMSTLIGAGVGIGYELSEIASRKLVGDQQCAAQKAGQLTDR
jgi:hypothetical protein